MPGDSGRCKGACLLNITHLGLAHAGFSGGVWLTNLVRGYNFVTVLVVANLAFSGLLVSWVMKFADSIMKVRPGTKHLL